LKQTVARTRTLLFAVEFYNYFLQTTSLCPIPIRGALPGSDRLLFNANRRKKQALRYDFYEAWVPWSWDNADSWKLMLNSGRNLDHFLSRYMFSVNEWGLDKSGAGGFVDLNQELYNHTCVWVDLLTLAERWVLGVVFSEFFVCALWMFLCLELSVLRCSAFVIYCETYFALCDLLGTLFMESQWFVYLKVIRIVWYKKARTLNIIPVTYVIVFVYSHWCNNLFHKIGRGFANQFVLIKKRSQYLLFCF